jgi:hypothetical protein
MKTRRTLLFARIAVLALLGVCTLSRCFSPFRVT